MRNLLMRKRFLRDEHGASAVEFAIILPVLLMLLFGIVEFGLAYRDYLAVTHAAREGARMAAVGEFSADEVAKRSYPVTPSSISLTYLTPDGTPKHGYPAEVIVRCDRPLNIPMFTKMTLHLVGKADMRVEF